MDYENFAQPWQENEKRREVIPTTSNDQWFYAHHPFNWELDHVKKPVKGRKVAAPVLVPRLKTVPHMPGVNGVRDNGDISLLNAKLTKQGYTIIDPREHDYLRIYPARGGNFHSSKFVKMESLAGRLIQSFQHAEFLAFRLGLVASGRIDLPHDHVIKLMLLDQQEKINRMERDQLKPDIKAKMGIEIQKLKDLEKAIADIREHGRSNYEIS